MNLHRALTPSLLLGFLALSTQAYAEEAPAPLAPTPMPAPGWYSGTSAEEGYRPPTASRWYGWQTLIGVIGSDAVFLVGLGMDGRNHDLRLGTRAIGVIGHVMTAPIVHWSHGYAGRGFASLGMNVGGPLLGGLLGLGIGTAVQKATDSSSDVAWGALVGLIGGAATGAIAATILDTTLLSTEPLSPEKADARRRGVFPTSIALVPMLDIDRFGLSILGRF